MVKIFRAKRVQDQRQIIFNEGGGEGIVSNNLLTKVTSFLTGKNLTS